MADSLPTICRPEILMMICDVLAADITGNEQSRPLSSLALVNRATRRVAQNAMYSTIDVPEGAKPYSLLRTLIERPDLATRVQHIIARDDIFQNELKSKHWFPPRTDRDPDLLAQVIGEILGFDLSITTKSKLLSRLHAHHKYTYLAIILCLCENIRTMKIVAGSSKESYAALLDVIEERASRLQRLTAIDWVASEDFFARMTEKLMSLPALMSLHVNFENHARTQIGLSLTTMTNLRRLEFGYHMQPSSWKCLASFPNLRMLNINWSADDDEYECDWDIVSAHLTRHLESLQILSSKDIVESDEHPYHPRHRGRLTIEEFRSMKVVCLPLEAFVNPEQVLGLEITDSPWESTSHVARLLDFLPSLSDTLPESIEEVNLVSWDEPGHKSAYLDKSVQLLTADAKHARLSDITISEHGMTVPPGWIAENDDRGWIYRLGSPCFPECDLPRSVEELREGRIR